MDKKAGGWNKPHHVYLRKKYDELNIQWNTKNKKYQLFAYVLRNF